MSKRVYVFKYNGPFSTCHTGIVAVSESEAWEIVSKRRYMMFPDLVRIESLETSKMDISNKGDY